MRMVVAMFGAMAVGAAAVLWMPTFEDEQRLAVITDISERGFAKVAPPSDDSDAAMETAAPSPTSGNVLAVSTTSPNFKRTSVREGEIIRASGSPAGLPDVVGALSGAARLELVRELQRELKRAGCYAGAVDGDWGTKSRAAMRSFVETIKSSLPSNDPDYILLTLVQGYSGVACKDAEAAAKDDRSAAAVPVPVSRVQVKASSAATQSDWASTTTKVLPPAPTQVVQSVAPLEGRMSVGASHSTVVLAEPRSEVDNAPPVVSAPPPPPRRTAPPRRRNTSWTAEFFNRQY